MVAALFLFIPQFAKRPKAFRKKWLEEKFGHFEFARKYPAAGFIWVHAVSVGEVNASIPLLKRINEAFPEINLILSTITDTGQKVALSKVPPGTEVVYLPFDVGFILKRCLKGIRLKLFIAIETEIWPNVFRIMAHKKVPVLVLNGRISEKSCRGYEKVSFFMKKVFMYVNLFGMQSPSDAERLRRTGADSGKIVVIGNFKFDMDMQGKIPSWTSALRGPVIVAGSTHPGEEAIVISAFKKNLENFPELTLILAPRHPERFKEVEGLLLAEGVPFLKRSGWGLQIPGIPAGTIILLDVMGELAYVYSAAHISIIGKSFTGLGGQNPLEPAYWGKAVICGTHMENFPFIRDFYCAGAAFEVEAGSLAEKIHELLAEPEKAKAAGEKARALCAENSGAVGRAMEIIKKYIGN